MNYTEFDNAMEKYVPLTIKQAENMDETKLAFLLYDGKKFSVTRQAKDFWPSNKKVILEVDSWSVKSKKRRAGVMVQFFTPKDLREYVIKNGTKTYKNILGEKRYQLCD